jgi:excinuclease UvrABC nuclease subunit
VPNERTEKIDKLFVELKRAPLHKFPSPRGHLEAPSRQGVYVIYSPSGRVLHVGSTPRARKGIAQRLRNHMSTQSSFTIKYLGEDGSRLRRGYKFRCLIVRSERRRALLEAHAIGQLCPAHIGLGRSALAVVDK